MSNDPDHFEQFFAEAAQQWDLARLYRDLEAAEGKELKPFERACLRGLLCRYRPGQIAFKLSWTSGALRIEAVTDHPANTLRWEKVPEWLDGAGYRLQRVPSVGDSFGSGQHSVLPDPSVSSVTADVMPLVNTGVSSSLNNSLNADSVVHRSVTVDWGEAPDIPQLYGRTKDLATLETWIVVERVRLVAICGMGGIGKTSLAVKLVENLLSGGVNENKGSHFDVCIWRSLRGAQPTTQILMELLQGLTRESKEAGTVTAVMEQLRQKRCLIILDDMETVLQDGELVGSYRPGCDGYGELLERVGSERHQSCLIILSREQPKEISAAQTPDGTTRAYRLSGLSQSVALALLQSRGFTELPTSAVGNSPRNSHSLAALVEQYRGNPAALRIVATTIQELFNGNVTEFLQQTGLALGDVLRSLLYQQVARLSDLERSVLYWLALKRRAISLVHLRRDMHLQGGSALIDALESLRWRSLIEKNVESGEVGFALEPVVMKYVSRQFIEEVTQEITELVNYPHPNKLHLLRSHVLVEDYAPDTVRAMQIRLVLKPIKDHLIQTLHHQETTLESLQHSLMPYRQTLSTDYADTNLTLLGIW